MKSTKNTSYIIFAIFLGIILLPLMTTNLQGSDYSAAEKRFLAPFPNLLQDGKINSNVDEELDDWLSDHIGFRESMVHLASKIKFSLFNQSPSDLVHIGKDGWYFYNWDNNLEIATGKYPLSQETLDKILHTHLAIQKKLAEKGIEYVVIMPCSKVSIYPEYMRYGNGEYRITPVDIVADYLEANSDIKVVRTKEILLEAKEEHQVFFKTDTHWTRVAVYEVYKEIIDLMQTWGLCNTTPANVELIEGDFTGEFGSLMGRHDFLPPEKTLETSIQNQRAQKYDGDNLPAELAEKINNCGVYNPCYYYKNDSVNDNSKVLMFGDSMYGAWNATELLAENFSEFTYIWTDRPFDEIIDYVRPNIVIYEVTERFLNYLPTFNTGYLLEPIGEHHSEIVSQSIDGNDLVVNVKNTSSVSWAYGSQIRCGILENGLDTGVRADIYPGVTVLPGETVELRFKNIGMTFTSGHELVMLQESIAYFPERVPVNLSLFE